MRRFLAEERNEKRLCALLMAVLIFTAFFSLSFYIVLEAGHDCPGDGCEICARIAVCTAALRSFAVSAAVVAVTGFATAFVRFSAKLPRIFPRGSLITLKVKLSD